VGFLERTEWDGDLTCAGIGSGSRAAAPPASTGLSSQIPQRPPTTPLTASPPPPPPPASPPGPAGVGASASCRSLRITELRDLERQGLGGLGRRVEKSCSGRGGDEGMESSAGALSHSSFS
jgi:hypothetical protein